MKSCPFCGLLTMRITERKTVARLNCKAEGPPATLDGFPSATDAWDHRAEDEEAAPYVCPGCHAIAEPCAPGCVDDAIDLKREQEQLYGNGRDYDSENPE